jgi:hypothetical protein
MRLFVLQQVDQMTGDLRGLGIRG